ncbi:MAG TPA: hypothetical protein VM097_00625 [Mycobacteriales bacterium]|nr:hypothetical protein [Mycobacteriales bacterium]
MQRSRSSLVLAVLAAGGLAYDAYVHLDLAQVYDGIGDTITQGGLFRFEAALAIVVALAVLLSDHRLVWLGVGMTGLGGVAAVVLYRYVDVGAIGPIPNMYEPLWYDEKTWSALAEAGVALVWIIRETLRFRDARDPRAVL